MRLFSPYEKMLNTLGVLLLIFLLPLQASAQQETASGPVDANYRLASGDRILISVFNQEELSGEYTLDGSGGFFMHLVGRVQARDLTAGELESLLVDKLRPDYLVNPRVSVSVLTFRPFYIIGEVGGAGAYPFVDGMTYLNAIAIAGGYTFRAREDVVYVKRAEAPEEEEIRLSVNERVQPGDIIRVAERIF